MSDSVSVDDFKREPAPAASRRAVLQGAASALSMAALAGLCGALRSAGVCAAATQRDRRALTIVYPRSPEIRFDAKYYRDHHTKLFMSIYGRSIERFELRTVDALRTAEIESFGADRASASKVVALINVWLADFDDFTSRSTAAAYARMGDDKKNFTNAQSTVQLDEVQCSLGEPRSSPAPGDRCVSILYPNGPGARWDSDRYCRTLGPEMMQLLGSEAIRRIEVRRGLQLLDGGAPAYLGGINIYLRDPRAFAKGWTAHGAKLEAQSNHLANARPLRLSTDVFGVDAPPSGT